ncbi:hypothetical protein SRHO_G00254040 [Serrasalmus rhombeus]
MFSEYRIHPALLLLLYCLLCSAGEEVVRLQELEGNTVTIHTGLTGVQTPVSKPVIRNQAEKRSVSLGESCSPLCSVENGKDVSLSWYEEKERISSISSSDSSERLYLPLNKTNPNNSTYTCVAANPVSTQTTQLNITNICIKSAPVSKPVIRNQAEKRSVSLRESCSPLCSVENGKDVSLSWYEEKERISSISSSDSSEHLYLPLNKTNPDCSTYTCVAANPVSTQTTQLNITNICCKSVSGTKGPRDLSTSLAAVLTPVGLIVALSLILLGYKQQVYKHDKLNYAVKSTSPDSNEAHKKSNIGLTGDQYTLVVYSAIRT